MPLLTRMIGFLITNDAERATKFYRDVLGFGLMGEDQYAVVFDANGTMLRLNKGRDFKPAHGTVLGWEVDDIHAAIRELGGRVVQGPGRKPPFHFAACPQTFPVMLYWMLAAEPTASWFNERLSHR